MNAARGGGQLSDESPLKPAAAEASAWLLESAWPLWSTAGFDPATRLFREKLDIDGTPLSGPMRVRVQARQTYVFAEAGRLGWPGCWRDRVTDGLRALVVNCRADGGAVGHMLGENGGLIDGRRDLYDQAFALFGLAHARALDPGAADARIREISQHLETQREGHGGYREGEIQPYPRRQNPHMHLLEAGMALMEAGSPLGEPLAAECVDLFERRFFDSEHGAVGEYYDSDLARAPGDLGRVAEPGHHFEWIWLLDRWRRLAGRSRLDLCSRLWSHAVEHGLNGPVAIDEVWREGGAKSRSARLWPQTERLKAAIVMFEATGELKYRDAVLAAYAGLRLYLSGVRPGLYRDRLSGELEPVQEPSPASSLYHITLALSELIRASGVTPYP
jgi:mannose/cellobiose epimerase-like protein (N-acyl-D-glucosamine 2-epimerase family)